MGRIGHPVTALYEHGLFWRFGILAESCRVFTVFYEVMPVWKIMPPLDLL